jgi:hypothetical protein
MAKHESEHRCTASNARGEPCQATIIGPDGFCPAHAGGGRDMRELGRQGGKARGCKKEERAGDALEARAYAALEELLSSGSATARVQAAKFALDRLTANSPAGLEVAKRALWLDQQAERALALPAAREKLARLVERDAQARAEAITAEQVDELVAQRAEERAEEMYAARMVAETEVVKAELRVDAPAVASPPAEELIAKEQRRQERERIARERWL